MHTLSHQENQKKLHRLLCKHVFMKKHTYICIKICSKFKIKDLTYSTIDKSLKIISKLKTVRNMKHTSFIPKI